jgi:hypothetical protein
MVDFVPLYRQMRCGVVCGVTHHPLQCSAAFAGSLHGNLKATPRQAPSLAVASPACHWASDEIGHLRLELDVRPIAHARLRAVQAPLAAADELADHLVRDPAMAGIFSLDQFPWLRQNQDCGAGRAFKSRQPTDARQPIVALAFLLASSTASARPRQPASTCVNRVNLAFFRVNWNFPALGAPAYHLFGGRTHRCRPMT